MTTPPTATNAPRDLAEGKKLAGCFLLKSRMSGPDAVEVWRAEDEVLGKEVSLHFLPSVVVGDKMAMNALRQDIKRTRALIHPNILRVYDLVEEADWAAISMDVFEGESLAALLKQKGRLDPADIEHWCGLLCQTLEEAHKINLIHRDLAPENIIVSESRRLLLAGFGTSRIIQDALDRARGGGPHPRTSNLSPQLLDAQLPTRADDVYGVGALLFEVLSGRPLFADSDIVQQIQKVVPPKVSEARAVGSGSVVPIPAAWDQTIASCLSKQPSDRPASLTQISTELAASASSGIVAPAPRDKTSSPLAEGLAGQKASNTPAKPTEATASTPKKKAAEILAERAAQYKAGIEEEKPADSAVAAPPTPPAGGKKKPAEILAERAAQFKAEGSTPPPQKLPEKKAKTENKSADKRTEIKPERSKSTLAPPGSDVFQSRQSRSPLVLVALAALVVVGGAYYLHYWQSQNQAAISPDFASTRSSADDEFTAVNNAIGEAPVANQREPIASAGDANPSVASSAETPDPDIVALTADSALASGTTGTVLAQNTSEGRVAPGTGDAAPPVPMSGTPNAELAQKAAFLEKIKQEAAAAEMARQETLKKQQEADAAVAELQRSIEQKVKTAAPLKKAVDDLLVTRTKREEEQKAADAAAKAAQEMAAEKIRAAEEAAKALAAFEAQNQDKLAAYKAAETDLQSMNQTLAERQAAADTAAKASAEAEALRMQQAAAMKETEAEYERARATAEAAAAEAEKKRVAMESERRRLDAELAEMRAMFEQKMKDIEDRRRQLEEPATPAAPPTKVAEPPSAEGKPAGDAALTLAMKTTPESPVTMPTNATEQPATSENSLGLKFVKVGDVHFSIWQTRLKDFESFAKAVNLKSKNWKAPGFRQEPDHPVVNVTWTEAVAFCKWLTDKERKEGLLPANQFYRLPTDTEWSVAVGLPDESGKTPEARDLGVKDIYPWGTQWPPPPGAGNYTGEETGSDAAIKGYNDNYPWTAPVGSFAPNKFGLYDMGGNVWQWCMDAWNRESKAKVLRGASWYNGALRLSLLASCRDNATPDSSTDNYGFRIVRAADAGGRSARRP